MKTSKTSHVNAQIDVFHGVSVGIDSGQILGQWVIV